MIDHDPPEVTILGDTKQRARKEYRCGACPIGGPPSTAVIPPGQTYRKLVGLEEGRFWIHRECSGPCPHASNCAVCNGTGEDPDRKGWGYCDGCDGTGKVRRASEG